MSLPSPPSFETASTMMFRRNQSFRRRYRSQLAPAAPKAQSQQPPQPPAELSENQSWLRLTMDVPGVLAKDLEVEIHPIQGILSVQGCRRHFSIDGTICLKKYKFQRRFAMDTQVLDVTKAKAEIAHGVLTITAPKKQSAPLTSSNNSMRLDVSETANKKNHAESASLNDALETPVVLAPQSEATSTISSRPQPTTAGLTSTRTTTIPLDTDDSGASVD